MLLCALIAGCPEGMSGGGRDRWSGLFAPKGETWTIRCVEFQTPDRKKLAEETAEALRRTEGIDAGEVKVEHGEETSSVYYGEYVRRIDPETKRMEVTEEMNADMALIKDLGVPGQGRYFPDARFVPMPTPDVGNPEWALEKCQGVYSLRVAIFFNEPGFYERKKAAAAYTRELREKGYRAFYRHGSIHSEVFVGEFGEDALETVKRESDPDDPRPDRAVVGMTVVSPEVRALQAKENFRCELWNMRMRIERVRGKRVCQPTRLVPVHEEQEPDMEGYYW